MALPALHHLPRWPTMRRAWQVAIVAVSALAACTPRAQAGRIEPGVEQRLLEDARPGGNRFLVFRWSLREGQSRFSGQGAARIAQDMRARLDLFGPQDVPYLSAILRDDRLSLPAGVPAHAVPPAPLLWTALGVIRPPDGARLAVAQVDGRETRLAYEAADGVWSFLARDGVLISAEWRAGDGARHTVELTGAVAGAPPRSALYRDWQEYRELTLEIEDQEEVDAFPPETWILDAR